MQIAVCPECLGPVGDDDMLSDQLRLALVCGMLMGSAAVTGLLVTMPDHALAEPGFKQRLVEIVERLGEDVDAFVDWGDAYD